MKHRDLLESALHVAGFGGDRALDLFETYHGLLLEWNGRMNLVSRGDTEHVIPRHFLPSMGVLLCVDFPAGSRVLDLGSGAGFPGLPMKIVRPDLDMTLLDSKRRRTAFLKTVIRVLDLEGIRAVQARVEEASWDRTPFDFIVSRAVTDLVTLSGWTRSLLSENRGALVTIKGPDAEDEILRLDENRGALAINSIDRHPFNPFPEIAPLNESMLVVVRW